MNFRRVRLAALVPLILSLTAFILCMLCIFAGSKTGYLESANLLTLDTSKLGQSAVHKPAGKVAGDIAKEYNLQDFYSAHLMNYCEGELTASAGSKSTSSPPKKITGCSKPASFFHFDPIAILQKELKHGVNLTTDLQWPSAIQEAVRVVGLSSKGMFLFYGIGAMTTGFALVGALLALLSTGRMLAAANSISSMVAFFSLMIASAIATGMISEIVDSVNTFGTAVGITATKGMTFIDMTWAADVLVFLNGLVWAYEFRRVRREMYGY